MTYLAAKISESLTTEHIDVSVWTRFLRLNAKRLVANYRHYFLLGGSLITATHADKGVFE